MEKIKIYVSEILSPDQVKEFYIIYFYYVLAGSVGFLDGEKFGSVDGELREFWKKTLLDVETKFPLGDIHNRKKLISEL